MSINSHKITVFIPTYNRLEMLKNAVQSVLSQGDFVKVHILDNASTDGTPNWLEELNTKEGARVKLTLRRENIGALKNFSEGFSSVTTQYCVPLADDDELLPNFLQKALDIAETNAGIGGVVFQTQVLKKEAVLHLSPKENVQGIIKPLKHLAKWCAGGHYFSWSSILWNTELLLTINAQNEFYKHGSFGDAWIQFLAFSQRDFYLVEIPGAVLNIHENQASQQFSSKFIDDMASILVAVKRELLKRNDLDESKANQLVASLFQNWNQMIQGQCWNLNLETHKHEACEILDSYLRNFGKERFIDSFALLPLFSEYRTEIDKNNKKTSALINENYILSEQLEARNSELSWMHKSLSWKITKPLRAILSIMRR
jgi:glycosyltransferase involved in cell wall biosynthesis